MHQSTSQYGFCLYLIKEHALIDKHSLTQDFNKGTLLASDLKDDKDEFNALQEDKQKDEITYFEYIEKYRENFFKVKFLQAKYQFISKQQYRKFDEEQSEFFNCLNELPYNCQTKALLIQKYDDTKPKFNQLSDTIEGIFKALQENTK